MLRHPCILGDPQRQARGVKSGVVPNKGGKNLNWVPHPCLLGGAKRGRECYVTPAFSEIPNVGEQKLKWLPHTCLLEGRKEGSNATALLYYQGSPTPSAGSKFKSGPQHRGTKPEVAASPLPFGGPQRGR